MMGLAQQRRGRHALLQCALAALAVMATGAQAQEASNNQSSTSTIISSLVLNLIIFAVEMTAFIILRPRFPMVYRPKTFKGHAENRVAPLSDSLFGWIPEFLKVPTSEILYKNGLDAYQFVAFCEMMIWFFAPVFLFSWALLMPLYGAPDNNGKQGFLRFTYGNVGPARRDQLRLIAVLGANYIIILYWIWVMYRFVAAFVKNRQEFLTNPKHAASAQARSILITGIPNNYLSERKLTSMYSQFPGGVAKVWLNRDLKEIPDLFDERLKACNKLEAACAKIQKVAFKKIKKGKAEAPGATSGHEKDAEMNMGALDKYLTKKERPTHKLGALGLYGEKVDTFEWAREEIPRLTKEIETRRSAAETDYETYPAASAAFIMFNNQIAAHMAVKAHAHHEPYRMANHYVEAHPDDIIWPNLSMNPYAAKIRTAIAWTITIVIVLFWTVVTLVVGFISNLSGTANQISWLNWINSIPTVVVGIIQGILPTVLLAVFNILLVMFLRFLGRFSGIPTHTGVELALFDRMAIFSLVQNFLILTIISGVSSGINQIVPIISDPVNLPQVLAQYVPSASNFFLSYVILSGLTGTASGFLQIAPLIIYYVKKFLLASTPRKVWHIDNDMRSVAWGTQFASTTLISVIGIGYTVMAPIMNLFAFVAFTLFFLMYKFSFTYVFNMSGASETAGLFFPKAVNFCFAAMYLQMVIQTVLFFISQDTQGNVSATPEGAFMVVLIIIVILLHYLLLNSYGDLFTALPLSLVPPVDSHDSTSPGSQEKKPLLSGDGHQDDDVNGRAGYNSSKPQENGTEDPLLAFTRPSMKANQREIWIADDPLGLGRAEDTRNRQAGVLSTMRDATRDDKGAFHVSADCPPGEFLP